MARLGATNPAIPEPSEEQWDELWLQSVFENVNITFTTNPYWSRIWVFQELALATEAIVTAGSHSIPLDHFLGVVQKVEKLPVSYEEASANVFFFRQVQDIRRRRQKKQLGELLSELRSQSSDPRDIVYALLGITTIGVDYEKEANEVFWDAMLECTTPWYLFGFLFDRLTMMMDKNQVRPTTLGLVEYARSKRTSERHKQGAGLALETSMAIGYLQLWFMDEMVYDEPEKRLSDFLTKVKRIGWLQFCGRGNIQLTYFVYSAMIGFILAMRRRKGMEVDRSVCREVLLQEICSAGIPSPWRCRRHGSGFPQYFCGEFLYSVEDWDLGCNRSDLWTLCGMCKLERVDELPIPGVGDDADFIWRPDGVGLTLVVKRLVGRYTFRDENGWVSEPKLKLVMTLEHIYDRE
ncbi:hypothetical protein LTR10_018783 [Elasticomyces elasticus]|nr:hypothetical protein LTR10_018783 [Elasticomyces elasticus]KAK5029909.1 hypothetical protein LTS07_005633 [Exophiala sideris]